MRRRNLLRRVGSAGLIAVGAAGAASASEPDQVAWIFEDGHREVMTRAEFDRRPDTPSLADIEGIEPYSDWDECCVCPDVEGHCTRCRKYVCP